MHDTRHLRKAVIPVGGLGTRLLPMTKVLPKELLPMGRRPMIQYVVEEVRAAGLNQVCLVTGRKKTLIQEHFDHDPELVRQLQDRGRDDLLAELAYLESGLHLTYIRQRGPEGLADAVSMAEGFAGEQPFVVALGDSVICEVEMGALLRRMIREHLERGAVATIAVEPLASTSESNSGIVCPMKEGVPEDDVFDVADVTNRPSENESCSNLAIAARFVFSPAIFAATRRIGPEHSGEMQLTDAVRVLLREGGKVQAVRLTADQRRHNIGSVGGYFRAFLEFALMDRDCGDDVFSYVEELASRGRESESDD